mmetsp:Transcript_35764/g.58355  ORF Transcript_35764/g.58355 Transcript_35764/m.58355 type:complete len:260 (-) Transcript_35764:8-787(-)
MNQNEFLGVQGLFVNEDVLHTATVSSALHIKNVHRAVDCDGDGLRLGLCGNLSNLLPLSKFLRDGRLRQRREASPDGVVCLPSAMQQVPHFRVQGSAVGIQLRRRLLAAREHQKGGAVSQTFGEEEPALLGGVIGALHVHDLLRGLHVIIPFAPHILDLDDLLTLLLFAARELLLHALVLLLFPFPELLPRDRHLATEVHGHQRWPRTTALPLPLPLEILLNYGPRHRSLRALFHKDDCIALMVCEDGEKLEAEARVKG